MKTIELNVKGNSVTDKTVTLNLTLSADNAGLLSGALQELADALAYGHRRATEKRRALEALPYLQAQRDERDAAVRDFVAERMDLPIMKVASLLNKEAGYGFLSCEFRVRDARKEIKKAARDKRDDRIMELKRAGLNAPKIAAAMQLSAGTVRNLLCKHNSKASPPELLIAPDAAPPSARKRA